MSGPQFGPYAALGSLRREYLKQDEIGGTHV